MGEDALGARGGVHRCRKPVDWSERPYERAHTDRRETHVVKRGAGTCGGVGLAVGLINLSVVQCCAADDAALIKGTVWDLGDVLANAQVYIWKYKDADGYHQIDHPRTHDEIMDLPTCTRTDEDGRFSLPWIEGATEVALMARNAEGLTRGEVVIGRPVDPLKIVIRLGYAQPRRTEVEGEDRFVAGLVWDNGAPCAGAQVFVMKYTDAEGEHSLLRPDSFAENPDSPYFTRTDEQGRFNLPWKDGALAMRVHARNPENAMRGSVLKAPSNSVLIVLRGGPPPPPAEPEPEPVKIRGQVLGGDHKPIPGASVAIWELSGPQAEPRRTAQSAEAIPDEYRTHSDENAMFEFTVPGGVRGVNLILSNAEIGTVHAKMAVGREEPQKVYLYIQPKAYVSGVVTDEAGQPVAGAVVRVYVSVHLGDNYHVETNAEGRFHIECDNASERTVVAEKEGVGFYATNVWTGNRRGVYASHDMNIVLRAPGAISGVVTDEATGAPMAGVEVKIWPYYVIKARAEISPTQQGMAELAERRFERRDVTDAHGRYRLECDAGTAHVHLDKFGHRFTGSLRGGAVRVPAGEEGEVGLTMRRLYGVMFVFDADGKEVSAGDINITTADGSRTYKWAPPPGATWQGCCFVEQPSLVLTFQPVNRANGMTCERSEVTVGDTPRTITLHLR